MSEVLGGWLMGCLPPGRYRISIEWTKVPFSDRPYFNLVGSFLSFRSQVLASWGFSWPRRLIYTHSFFYSFTYFFPSNYLANLFICLHCNGQARGQEPSLPCSFCGPGA